MEFVVSVEITKFNNAYCGITERCDARKNALVQDNYYC